MPSHGTLLRKMIRLRKQDTSTNNSLLLAQAQALPDVHGSVETVQLVVAVAVAAEQLETDGGAGAGRGEQVDKVQLLVHRYGVEAALVDQYFKCVFQRKQGAGARQQKVGRSVLPIGKSVELVAEGWEKWSVFFI